MLNTSSIAHQDVSTWACLATHEVPASNPRELACRGGGTELEPLTDSAQTLMRRCKLEVSSSCFWGYAART